MLPRASATRFLPVVCAALAATSCAGRGVFRCDEDADCVDGQRAGVCVAGTGLCAFFDDDCTSELRYGEHSGDLGGRCVQDGADGGTADAYTCGGGGCACFLDVSAGGDHTCAVRNDGAVWCWGKNLDGQLGDDTTQSRNLPVRVMGIEMAIAVDAGQTHTCAIVGGDDHVECWGRNDSGQLGSGSSDDSMVPVPVGELAGAVGVTAGGEHSCAVLADGSAYCWGRDVIGQLGDGKASPEPALEPQLVSLTAEVVRISAGQAHTCAVLVDGALACWGNNGFGQLGNGVTSDGPGPVPVVVGGLAGATDVGAGSEHTCAVAGGRVWCFGRNNVGQLGSDMPPDLSASPLEVGGLAAAAAVTAGLNHTCAALDDGGGRCWGFNASGQLGNENRVNQRNPVSVDGLSGATKIGAGSEHTCALAGGAVLCWGLNGEGQIGDGTNEIRLRPTSPLLACP